MSVTTFLFLAISLAVFAAMLGAQEVGYRIGQYQQRHGTNTTSTGAIEGAVLGLLGLLLAFQFSTSSTRLERRRDIGIEEANAVGTAYLRLDILPAEHQPVLRELFRRYGETRVAAQEAPPDMARVRAEVARGRKLQGEIWSRAVTACSQDSKPTSCMILLPAINQMIDVSNARWVASRIHAPVPIALFLLVVALLCGTIAGHVMSRGDRSSFHMFLFAAVIALTVHVIVDLEFPRVGFIRVGAPDDALRQARDDLRPAE